jgi:hypothetical protein
MQNERSDRLDLLIRSVYALLQWAETHPLTQWEQAGTLSALRLELEDAMRAEASRAAATNSD